MGLTDCKLVVSDRIISVTHQKKTFVINNPACLDVTKICLDSCKEFEKSERCDFAFYAISLLLALYVELKGTDLDKAFRQLENTLKLLAQEEKRIEGKAKGKLKRECYVVCSRVVPAFTPRTQTMTKKLKAQYGALLIVRTGRAVRNLPDAIPTELTT
jgi:hypothetical protein